MFASVVVRVCINPHTDRRRVRGFDQKVEIRHDGAEHLGFPKLGF